MRKAIQEAAFGVTRGSTFKEVADVLGHQSLATAEIYAKLDLGPPASPRVCDNHENTEKKQ
jgi:site-specific recombinase XerC